MRSQAPYGLVTVCQPPKMEHIQLQDVQAPPWRPGRPILPERARHCLRKSGWDTLPSLFEWLGGPRGEPVPPPIPGGWEPFPAAAGRSHPTRSSAATKPWRPPRFPTAADRLGESSGPSPSPDSGNTPNPTYRRKTPSWPTTRPRERLPRGQGKHRRWHRAGSAAESVHPAAPIENSS